MKSLARMDLQAYIAILSFGMVGFGTSSGASMVLTGNLLMVQYRPPVSLLYLRVDALHDLGFHFDRRLEVKNYQGDVMMTTVAFK